MERYRGAAVPHYFCAVHFFSFRSSLPTFLVPQDTAVLAGDDS
jgi:hypothetical protein